MCRHFAAMYGIKMVQVVKPPSRPFLYKNIYCPHNTVKREMLVAIIFGGFENFTIWQRFNLAILFKESGWARYFVIWRFFVIRQFHQINIRVEEHELIEYYCSLLLDGTEFKWWSAHAELTGI